MIRWDVCIVEGSKLEKDSFKEEVCGLKHPSDGENLAFSQRQALLIIHCRVLPNHRQSLPLRVRGGSSSGPLHLRPPNHKPGGPFLLRWVPGKSLQAPGSTASLLRARLQPQAYPGPESCAPLWVPASEHLSSASPTCTCETWVRACWKGIHLSAGSVPHSLVAEKARSPWHPVSEPGHVQIKNRLRVRNNWKAVSVFAEISPKHSRSFHFWCTSKLSDTLYPAVLSLAPGLTGAQWGQKAQGKQARYVFKQGLCTNLEEGWGGRWEGGPKGRGHMYTYGWFMLSFDRKQQNSIKQLSFN